MMATEAVAAADGLLEEEKDTEKRLARSNERLLVRAEFCCQQ